MNTSFFKRLRGWRTIGMNGLVVLFGLGTALGIIPVGVTPDTIAGGADAIIGGAEMLLGGANILLRLVTRTPAFKSD